MKLLDWLKAEPFTLTFSSGFFGFYAHGGVMQALEEAQTLPQKLTGASSGAIISSCWAAGLNAKENKQMLFDLTREDFWDPAGFKVFSGMGLLKGEKFRQLLDYHLPVKTFEQCRAKLALSAYDMWTKQTVVFDKGELIPAIYASCAIPVMFQPIEYQGYKLLDGGIKDRPALAGTQNGECIFYHHIASKSPWRKADSPSIQIPKRDNLISLVIYDLPRCGPTKLQLGPSAYEKAYQATLRALDRPIEDGMVALAC